MRQLRLIQQPVAMLLWVAGASLVATSPVVATGVDHGSPEPLRIAAGVPVLASMLEALLPEEAQVTTLLQPGQVPELFEPGPRELESAASADFLVLMGFAAERRWAELRDSQRVLILYPPELAARHPWTDPSEATRMMLRLSEWLMDRQPRLASSLATTQPAQLAALSALDHALAAQLAPFQGQAFLVYHPAWTAFAERYELRQLALEHDGHEPSARGLAELLSQVRGSGIRYLYRQPQEDSRLAESVAQGIGATVQVVDPLAADYQGAIKAFATLLQSEFAQRE